jgi:hypothetical protein
VRMTLEPASHMEVRAMSKAVRIALVLALVTSAVFLSGIAAFAGQQGPGV